MFIILITLTKYCLDFLLIVTIFFQVFYLLSSLVNKGKKSLKNDTFLIDYKSLSIIIPVFNSEGTVGQTLKSITRNNLNLIDKIIIVNDHSTDGSERVIKKFISNQLYKDKFVFVNFNCKKTGKVEAITEGINIAQSKYIMLLDADIILRRDAIEKLYQTHMKNNNFCTSCLIYPYKKPATNPLIFQIICNDRLYRQNILKPVRNFFDVANFPSSIGIIKSRDYKKYIKKGFLEDLKATYKIIEQNKKISIVPLPLAFEIERQSLRGLFLQRTRWTIGSIECTKMLVKAILHSKSCMKRMLLLSYPITYHIQYYLIFLGLFAPLLDLKYIIFNIPLVLYFLQIVLSVYVGKNLFKNSFLGICLHCIIFPIIITFSFFGAIYFLVNKKSFYFKSDALFKRI